jgi:two-component system NarL family sensor kinase
MDNLSQEITLIILASVFFIAVAVGIIIIILIYKKRQAQYISEKNQMKITFENEILKSQIEIQEQTLKTISQEIHDNVGQVLSLAKLNLGTFETMESEANQVKINDTKQLVSKAINDLRDLSRSLHGDKIAELGLQDSVANELKILQNTGQYQTALYITGDNYKLEAQKEMVLFRIVQESLNNAIKHAKAKNININIAYQPELFSLIISDDGSGFDPGALQSAETGIGLKSMQNRAALIGAAFTLNSQNGNGTTITIELKRNNLTT